MCDENNDFAFVAVSLFCGGPGAAEQVSPGHPALCPGLDDLGIPVPQVIQPFALGYNVVYTVLSAAYVIFLIYQYSTGATTWHLVLVVCSIVVLAATVFFTWKDWLRDRQ